MSAALYPIADMVFEVASVALWAMAAGMAWREEVPASRFARSAYRFAIALSGIGFVLAIVCAGFWLFEQVSA